MTEFSRSIQSWLNNPDGGAGCFKATGDKVRQHDPSCKSLEDVWMPHKGGTTCLSDLFWCQECEVDFYNEGLRILFEDCPGFWHYYCECCSRTATHPEGGCESGPDVV